jgi:hypothetical protein
MRGALRFCFQVFHAQTNFVEFERFRRSASLVFGSFAVPCSWCSYTMPTPQAASRTLRSMLLATSVLRGPNEIQRTEPQRPKQSTERCAIEHDNRNPQIVECSPKSSEDEASATERAMDHPSSSLSPGEQAKLFKESEWQKAYSMLQNNPKLMTNSVLHMALKRRAPIQLVRFMLELNPKSALVPRHGPSPLQVAVQSLCGLDVVQATLEKCPCALVVTNPGSYLDPLSYAKRFRSTEADLISLLSLPINHWTETGASNSGTNQKTIVSTIESVHRGTSASPIRIPRHPFMRTNPPNPMIPTRSSSSTRTTGNFSETLEMNNIKLISLAVLKGHKRLTKEMSLVTQQVASICAANFSMAAASKNHPTLPDISKLLKAQRARLSESVREQLEKAMDAKVKAVHTSVENAERRLVASMQQNQDETAANLETYMKAVADGLQARLQKFHDRINLVESTTIKQLERRLPMASKTRQASSHKTLRVELKASEDWTTPTISPSSFTYRSDSTGAISEIEDKCMPMFYAAPNLTWIVEGDEMQSLLSKDVMVYRPMYHRRAPYARVSSKPLTRLFCRP